MPGVIRTFTALAAVAIAMGVLGACGGSDPGGEVVATVGKSTITQNVLSHWMEADVAGDYREMNAQVAPPGLVSDPPDYSRCVASAKTIVTSSGAPTKLSDAKLTLKCRQLYAALKEQALAFLISALWRIEDAAEHGQSASEAEVSRVLQRNVYAEYPNPAQFRRYLAQNHRSLGDERYLLKRNILTEKFFNGLKAQAGSGASGEKALTRLVLQNNAKWTARTDCRAGYRAFGCKQYSPADAAPISASVLVEDLKAGR